MTVHLSHLAASVLVQFSHIVILTVQQNLLVGSKNCDRTLRFTWDSSWVAIFLIYVYRASYFTINIRSYCVFPSSLFFMLPILYYQVNIVS